MKVLLWRSGDFPDPARSLLSTFSLLEIEEANMAITSAHQEEATNAESLCKCVDKQ